MGQGRGDLCQEMVSRSRFLCPLFFIMKTTKLSDKEWRDLILVEYQSRGGRRYYSAICPICLTTYDVDISPARTLAVEKVASHIKNAHSGVLT